VEPAALCPGPAESSPLYFDSIVDGTVTLDVGILVRRIDDDALDISVENALPMGSGVSVPQRGPSVQ
jgi:hypothetical protein